MFIFTERLVFDIPYTRNIKARTENNAVIIYQFAHMQMKHLNEPMSPVNIQHLFYANKHAHKS